MASWYIQEGIVQNLRNVLVECNWVCSEFAQGPFRESFSGKLGNPMQTVGRTALWQNYCADNAPDTRSKPVVRRSLFHGLLYLLGIFKVPQNAIRVDIRVILSGYSLKPEKANNELHRLWMSIHGISRLSAS